MDDHTGFSDDHVRTKQDMDDREKYLMRMALIYAISNLGDVNDAFYEATDEGNAISVNGDIGKPASEEELDNLLNTLQ